MAETYTPQLAVDYCSYYIHGIPVDGMKVIACDQVNSIIHCYYPWGWSVGSLTAINCTDGVQDYTPTNTDILRPLKFRLVRTDISPNEYRELSALANLSPELSRKGGLDTITSYGFYSSTNFIRLNYAASVAGTQVLQIQGEYQKKPTRITDALMQTVFAMPDRYFNVFVEGLKWQFYLLSDDPRAGTLQMQKNGSSLKTYTAQYGVFMNSLAEMARTEDLQAGDEFRWPETPIATGRTYWPGLLGL